MSFSKVLEDIRFSPEPPNEEAAKFKIIAPILQNLGWDIYGPQVLYEHSVGKQRGGGRVDIALKGARRLVAIIEAKAPGSDLSNHVAQVLGYAFHEGVEICALTNGLEWWLYLPREGGDPEERRFMVLSIADDPVDRLADDLETFLSKTALESGDAVSKAKQVLKAEHERVLLGQRIPDIWLKMVKQPDEELLEIISKRVYNEIGLRPTREQVIDVLHDRPVRKRPVKSDLPKAISKPDSTRAQKRRTPQQTSLPTSMILFGVSYTIHRHAKSFATLVEVLYERDQASFGKLLDLGRGKRPYVSQDASELIRAKRVGTSDYFVEVNLSGADIWRRARLFMNHLGYKETDLQLLYD
ncbi:hypothetical protein [Candidatus Poriferisocius sp.]|uniref:hypothetical protein n=1 Tax=Candidatus Poriferisocius sp. TaxID=3101276 RepID=UPI003B015B6A